MSTETKLTKVRFSDITWVIIDYVIFRSVISTYIVLGCVAVTWNPISLRKNTFC